MLADQFAENSFDVLLPPANSELLSLTDLEVMSIEIQNLLHQRGQSLVRPEVASLDDYLLALQSAGHKGDGIADGIVQEILNHKFMFLPGNIALKEQEKYADSLAKFVVRNWKGGPIEENVNKKQIIGLVWAAATPTSVLSGMVIRLFQRSPSVSKLIIQRIVEKLELRLGIKIDCSNILGSLVRIGPLLRAVEIEERTQILVAFLSRMREYTSESKDAWYEIATSINQLSDNVVFSKLNPYFKTGYRESKTYQEFYIEVSKVAGDPAMEDQVYQVYVNKLLGDVKKILFGSSYHFSKATSEEGLMEVVDQIYQQVSMKMAMILVGGSLLYDPLSVKKKIIESIKELRSSSSLDFEQKFLSLLLPVSFFSENDACSLGNADLSKNVRDSLNNYLVFFKSFLEEARGLIKFKPSSMFFRRLMLAFDSPMRNYFVLGFLEANFIENLAPELLISSHGPLDQSSLMNYWLLGAEEGYFNRVILPFLSELEGRNP